MTFKAMRQQLNPEAIMRLRSKWALILSIFLMLTNVYVEISCAETRLQNVKIKNITETSEYDRVYTNVGELLLDSKRVNNYKYMLSALKKSINKNINLIVNDGFIVGFEAADTAEAKTYAVQPTGQTQGRRSSVLLGRFNECKQSNGEYECSVTIYEADYYIDSKTISKVFRQNDPNKWKNKAVAVYGDLPVSGSKYIQVSDIELCSESFRFPCGIGSYEWLTTPQQYKGLHVAKNDVGSTIYENSNKDRLLVFSNNKLWAGVIVESKENEKQYIKKISEIYGPPKISPNGELEWHSSDRYFSLNSNARPHQFFFFISNKDVEIVAKQQK